MIDAKLWIEHLSDPLVLVGFGFFVFATLAAVVVKERRDTSANAKLAVKMIFGLSVIITLGGFFIAIKKIKVEPDYTDGTLVDQSKKDMGNSNFSSGKGVINKPVASDKLPSPMNHENKTDSGGLTTSQSNKSTKSIVLTTSGVASPAIESGGDVTITYGKSE